MMVDKLESGQEDEDWVVESVRGEFRRPEQPAASE